MFSHYMGDLKLKVKDEPQAKKTVHYITIYIIHSREKKKLESSNFHVEDILTILIFSKLVMFIYPFHVA